MKSLTKEAEDDDQILQNPQPSTSTQVSKNRYDRKKYSYESIYPINIFPTY